MVAEAGLEPASTGYEPVLETPPVHSASMVERRGIEPLSSARKWSRQSDSNRRRTAWKAADQPLAHACERCHSPRRGLCWCAPGESNSANSAYQTELVTR